MFHRARTALLSLTVLAAGAGAATAQEGRLAANCYRATEAKPPQVLCDLRTTGPGRRPEIESVTVRLPDGKQVRNTQELFSPKARSSAWLFLIQTTDHPRDGARTAEQLIRSDTKRSYGVYSFSDSTEELWRIGPGEDARRALEKGRTGSGAFAKGPDGGKPALYAAAREALQRLASFDADRRALVIIGTGVSSSDANRGYTEKDVLTLARDNNVVIHTIALTGNSGGEPANLRRLAEETGGVFEPSPGYEGQAHKALSSEFVESFQDFLENGVQIKMANAEVPDKAELLITAALKGSTRTLSADKVAVAPGRVIYAPPLTEQVTSWVSQNQLVTGLGAALVAALLAGLLFFVRRRPEPALPAGFASVADGGYGTAYAAPAPGERTARPAGDAGSYGETMILTPTNDRSPPQQIFAWLEFMDPNATRVPIGGSYVRIGRHDDNDICLANKSVHRQHAELHMQPDNSFVVRDLGTRNGVKVNQKRVEQKQLVDGDVIELGEVRMRYVAGNSAVRH